MYFNHDRGRLSSDVRFVKVSKELYILHNEKWKNWVLVLKKIGQSLEESEYKHILLKK